MSQVRAIESKSNSDLFLFEKGSYSHIETNIKLGNVRLTCHVSLQEDPNGRTCQGTEDHL